MAVEQGKVAEVQIIPAGSEAAGDHAINDEVLLVDKVDDFEETGGKVSVDGTVLSYTGIDYDVKGLLLASPLSAAVLDETDVILEQYSEEKWATVIIEDGSDSEFARIPMFMAPDIEDGIRAEEDQESCLIELEGNEWVVRDIVGMSGTRSSEVLFFNDSKILEDSSDGSIRLTHVPMEMSEHVYWNGLYQPQSEWSRIGKSVTLLDPETILTAGDEITVEYAYHPQKSIPVQPLLIGVDSQSGGNTHTLTPPAGAQVGDLFVIAASFGSTVACSDSRIEEEVGHNGGFCSFWGHLSTLDPIVVTGTGFLSWSATALAVYRGVTVGGWTLVPSEAPPANAGVLPSAEAVILCGHAWNGTVSGNSIYESTSPAKYTRDVDQYDSKIQAAIFRWAPEDGTFGNPPSEFWHNGSPGGIQLATLQLLGEG